jgi:hypothetical protein
VLVNFVISRRKAEVCHSVAVIFTSPSIISLLLIVFCMAQIDDELNLSSFLHHHLILRYISTLIYWSIESIYNYSYLNTIKFYIPMCLNIVRYDLRFHV